MSWRRRPCSRATPGAAVMLERHGLVTWGAPAESCHATLELSAGRRRRSTGLRRVGSAWEAARSRGRRGRSDRHPVADAARVRERSQPMPTAWSSRSTAARKRSRSLLGPGAEGQPGARRARPLIHTKHRPLGRLRPGDGRRSTVGGFVRGVEEYAAGTALSRAKSPTTRPRPFRPTAGHGWCSSPASARHLGPRRRRARITRDALPPPDRRGTPPARSAASGR
jgi:hypothetical protein